MGIGIIKPWLLTCFSVIVTFWFWQVRTWNKGFKESRVMAPDLCGDHGTPPHFSCLCPTFSPTERPCVHLLATSQDFLQNHRYERERDYVSKVLEGSISSWGLLRWLQHPWSHPFFFPLIILRNGIYFLPFPKKIQLCYSKITWWMMGNWIFMTYLAQHWEAWLAIHKGQNLNNYHDFKNNQEEKNMQESRANLLIYSPF